MSLQAAANLHKHAHTFDDGNPVAERNTRWALILTATMMVVEIIGGWVLNSMALLADGWHMSSHSLALGLSVLAYVCSRRFARDRRFTFGTWKIEILAGYTSAILLLGVAVLMAVQSVARLITPMPIQYDQAMALATLGLGVNLACAWLLRGSPNQHAGHSNDHGHGHTHAHHEDLNLRSAYLHVLADAATSVLAIFALFGGMMWGASWLDPMMGIVGAVLVTVWAWGLLRDSGRVLLDAEMDAPVVQEVREVIEDGTRSAVVSDLHVWRVGRAKYACALSVVTHADVDGNHFRKMLSVHEELAHVTVEVHRVPMPLSEAR